MSKIFKHAQLIQNIKNNNILINGNFNIWERGSSFSYSGYTADRWAAIAFNSNDQLSVQKITTGGFLDNNIYSIRLKTVKNNSYIILTQIIETLDLLPLKGDVVTLSFYARSPVTTPTNNFAGNISARCVYTTIPDNIVTNKTVVAGSEINSTIDSSWKQYLISFTIPSNAQTVAVEIYPTNTQTLPSNAIIDITQIKLETGPVATSFADVSYTTELLQCQRYYQKTSSELSPGGALKPLGHQIRLSTKIRSPKASISLQDQSENLSNLQASLDSNTDSLNIKGVAQGTYSNIKLPAIFIDGEVPYALPPSKVSGVYITRSSSTANIYWQAANNNNSDIESYHILYGDNIANLDNSLVVSGNSTLSGTVTELKEYIPYYFSIYAKNIMGAGPASDTITSGPVATVPSSPISVTGAWGFGQSTISWVAPSDNGGVAITGYLIQRDVVMSFDSANLFRASFNLSNQNNILNAVINNGTDTGSIYYYRVAAINMMGLGPWSSTFSLNKAVPSSPLRPSLVSGNTNAVFSWSAPVTDNGGSITGTIIQYHNNNDASNFTGAITINNGIGRSRRVDNLINNTTYYFRAAELNIYGTGAWSNSASVVPFRPVTPPGPPRSLTASWSKNIMSDNNKIYIDWDTPLDNGGATISNYRVQIDTNNTFASNNLRTFTTLASDTEYRVPSLNNGSTYHVRVAGINTSGIGIYASGVSLAETTPDAPFNVSATAGNTAVNITWSQPFSNGADISSYTIRRSVSANMSSPVSITGIASTSVNYTVTSLTNDTTYYFDIVAINRNGSGIASQTVFATPRAPATIPSAPSDLTLSRPSISSIIASVKAPINNGNSAITGYRLEYATNNSFSGATTSIQPSNIFTVNNVSNVSYYVRVAALNSVGVSPYVSGYIPQTIISPQLPSNIAVTPYNTSGVITWTPPSTGIGYGYADSVSYRLTLQGATTVSTINNNYTFSELSPGTQYYVDIQTVNAPPVPLAPQYSPSQRVEFTTTGTSLKTNFIYTISCNCNPYSASQNTSRYPTPAGWPTMNRTCIRCDGDVKKTRSLYISFNNGPWILVGGNRWVQGAPNCFKATPITVASMIRPLPFTNVMRIRAVGNDGKDQIYRTSGSWDIRNQGNGQIFIMYNPGYGGAYPWDMNIALKIDPALYKYTI
jgi:hypothetical protein